MKTKPSKADLRLAQVCQICTVCKYARKKQRGAIYNFVKSIERKLCPFCRAYERVYGKKASDQ